MKTLFLKCDYQQATAGLEGQFPALSHVQQMVEASTKMVAPDGTITALLLCDVTPRALHERAYKLWSTVSQLPSNRATAVGSDSLPRINRDGTLGKRLGTPGHVLKVLARHGTAQGSIGYLDATPDQPCHKTGLTKNHPEMLEGNKPLILLVDELYKQYLKTFYAKQQAEMDKAWRWRLWSTVFSTIYLARNFRTAYHRDSGNLLGVMSALMPLGKFKGGELVLPRWRIAIAFKPGDLLFFDPQQLHGNLPFQGERLSAAFYCEKRIAECGE